MSISPSASSSAVTLPSQPGKSILKKPPPPPQSLFSLSRLSKFISTPATNPATPAAAQGTPGDAETRTLKRAHFILPELTTVYLISAANPPSSPTVRDEKRNAELREADRRKRIVRSNSFSSTSEASSVVMAGVEKDKENDWWGMDQVESFYRECCDGREDDYHQGVSAALKRAGNTTSRSVDLSGIQLSVTTASVLSDIFTIEWGLRKLVLRECDLDELTLKPMLHSLLIPGTLSFLAIPSNRRMKTPAYKVLGAYLSKAKSLQFLDLAQNPLDKKAIEHIVAALPAAPSTGLVSLRLDECSLRPAALEALAHVVRTSSLRNISLRHNRISATGAVALALMIKDYPDAVPLTSPIQSPSSPPSAASSVASSPALSPGALPPSSLLQPGGLGSPPQTPTSPSGSFSLAGSLSSLKSRAQSAASSVSSTYTGDPILQQPAQAHQTHAHMPSTPSPLLPPPPKHPSQQVAGTTYTPYIPRSRRSAGPAPAPVVPAPMSSSVASAAHNQLSANGQPVPVITTSGRGGVTTRHPVPPSPLSPGRGAHEQGNGQGQGHGRGPSAALLDKVRALDALPRLGALRTLDLKGNDVRNGVTYIAQVLKRNRTLKVLNLSENKIDVPGLVQLAESLKYNSSLETLDLSRNPCCGPALDGITSLRTAFTLNVSLKRLFLGSTGMRADGAIALAEFLPESVSLLHLDLTGNDIGLAGVMALSGGLKANHVMRCLDLNIPPDNEEMARMCRDILNTCIRNTEDAEKSTQTPGSGGSAASGRGLGKGVWNMIEESELAKSLQRSGGQSGKSDALSQALEAKAQLEALLSRPRLSTSSSTPSTPDEMDPALIKRAKAILSRLSDKIQTTDDPTEMEVLLNMNDELTALLARATSSSTSPSVSSFSETSSFSSSSGVGLGLSIPNGSSSDSSLRTPSPSSELKGDPMSTIILNGSGPFHEEPESTTEEEDDEEIEEPVTPRLDKGKGRAEPEPEEPEKILSPSIASYVRSGVSEEEEEEEARRQAEFLAAIGVPDGIGLPSPTDRSRSWVEEEGEVFRKGQALLGPEEMEGEFAGEELRQELLQAEVERPPPRPIDQDEFGFPNDPLAINPRDRERERERGEARTPTGSAPSSPAIGAPPRPYAVRSRSSSASSVQTLGSLASAVGDGGDGSTTPTPIPGSPTVLRPSFLRRMSSASNETR